MTRINKIDCQFGIEKCKGKKLRGVRKESFRTRMK
jgi:hypothetical protein